MIRKQGILFLLALLFGLSVCSAEQWYVGPDGKSTNPGGDIMIHGSNASIGCLAMGDEAAEDLFILAAETGIDRISVVLSPVDFRKRVCPEVTHPLPEWTDVLYEQIKEELSNLTSQ